MIGIYLFSLAVLIGVELCVLFVVHPAVFSLYYLIGTGGNALFLQFKYLLVGISDFVIICELFLIKRGKFSGLSFVLFLNLALAIFFVSNARHFGTQYVFGREFYGAYKIGEAVLKFMIFLQAFVFFLKFTKLEIKTKKEIKEI